MCGYRGLCHLLQQYFRICFWPLGAPCSLQVGRVEGHDGDSPLSFWKTEACGRWTVLPGQSLLQEHNLGGSSVGHAGQSVWLCPPLASQLLLPTVGRALRPKCWQ